jgi:L-fuculose-phosphate aldolase
MQMNGNGHRSQIVEVCKRLYNRNMLAAADGNVSYRIDDQQILITPSGRQKAFIRAEDIAVTDLNGAVHEGQPSGERLMHLEVYRSCPKARAVVHAHPPHAVAWSLARPELEELPNDRLGEIILAAGRIPIVPYARATTAAMGEVLRPYLPGCRAMILSRHGALAWGESLEEALNGMERLEHSAQMLWLAEQLGGSKPMPASEVEALKAMRAEMGESLL